MCSSAKAVTRQEQAVANWLEWVKPLDVIVAILLVATLVTGLWTLAKWFWSRVK